MVLLQGSEAESYLLCYYTDEAKTKLKGTINLKHCMNISSSLLVEAEKKSKQVNLTLYLFYSHHPIIGLSQISPHILSNLLK